MNRIWKWIVGDRGMSLQPKGWRVKWCLAPFLTLFICLTACAHDPRPKLPLFLPFEVHKAGTKFDSEVRVTEYRSYHFNLRLGFKKNDPADRARVKKLVGGSGRGEGDRLVEPGIPIPLRLKINVIDATGEHPILEKDISELALVSSAVDNFDVQIYQIPLKRGLYRISVESLKDIPELLGIPIQLVISFHPNASTIPDDW